MYSTMQRSGRCIRRDLVRRFLAFEFVMTRQVHSVSGRRLTRLLAQMLQHFIKSRVPFIQFLDQETSTWDGFDRQAR